jgi:hypothetical protein
MSNRGLVAGGIEPLKRETGLPAVLLIPFRHVTAAGH